MAVPARFLFETDFAAPEIAPEEDGPAEETAAVGLPIHLDLMVAAEARGYDRGYGAGKDDAEAEAGRRLAAEAGRLASAAQGILAALDADRERIERTAVDLALVVARKLSAELVGREPTAEILALVRHCLGPLRQAPHLVIRVSESDADAIKTETDRIAHEQGFVGRLIVLGEPDLDRGDCRIEWADGGIVRNRAETEAEIDTIIRRHFRASAGGVEADETDPSDAADTGAADRSGPETGGIDGGAMRTAQGIEP